MAYLTREDGERFIIPSYREMLPTVQLREQIFVLSKKYGSYISLQKKNSAQYEVAFSSDIGYLLGESVWQYFKRPLDLIYCEAIPNTTEAILVIVRAGSVYLDGNFNIEGIAEELVTLSTQKNNFNIYIYGNVPIAEKQIENKFTFDPALVKSFTVLDKPAFPSLPLIKHFKLQLVDATLRANQLNLFSIKFILIVTLLIAGASWTLWTFFFDHAEPPPTITPTIAPQVDLFKDYRNALSSPAPEEEINQFFLQAKPLFNMPGWIAGDILYTKGTLTTTATSIGSRINTLLRWAEKNNINATLNQNNITITIKMPLPPARTPPQNIYPLQSILAKLTDRLEGIYPGNHLQLGSITDKQKFKTMDITINFSDISPAVFKLIALQCKDLPFVLNSLSFKIGNSVSGSIVIQALGS